MGQWSLTKTALAPPPLDELAPVIEAGLKSNFANVAVEVAHCPDLRQKPFGLAAEGLSGNERIADIGGPPNLNPVPRFDRKYSLLELTKLMELRPAQGFIIGPGAGPFHVVGVNCEGMTNMSYKGDQVTNLNYYAKVDEHEECRCERISSLDCAFMSNLFGSDGSPGHVIKIVASTRTGPTNFTQTIQDALKAKYRSQPISIGGVFLIKKGKANLHVMPDFPKNGLNTQEEKDTWLKFFDMSAPLVCLSVFHSYDPGLDLRIEHTHCFSEHNEGGHYHYDVTPNDVEYEAYFNVAKVLYRIDRPGS